jgi:uncharacterized OB-fold protein
VTDAQQQVPLPVARCPQCALVVYPATVTCCPACLTEPLSAGTADGDGVVWSCTVQRFPPKSPPYEPPETGFAPFVVAYVQTADGFRVEGIVAADDPSAVAIGRWVRLVGLDRDVPRYVLDGEDS